MQCVSHACAVELVAGLYRTYVYNYCMYTYYKQLKTYICDLDAHLYYFLLGGNSEMFVTSKEEATDSGVY